MPELKSVLNARIEICLICQTVDEYSEQMHDLSRKFFHELLRHHRFTKAFRLAVDLNDYDLFMDIHHAANRLRRKRQNDTDTTPDDVEDAEIDGLADLAQAALIKVRAYSDNASICYLR